MTSTEERLRKEARHMSSSSHRPLEDITVDFTNASNRLEPGQLVKDEWFTLFESVGALEIMDPKMDSGYVPEGDSFEADFDPAAPLTFEQILWIMDRIFALEIAWHDCYPLSQTLFTNLHIFRLLEPRQPMPPTLDFPSDGEHSGSHSTVERVLALDVLIAYCVAVIKSCAISIELVQSQNYYEEEDLVTHTFGRELLPRLTVEDSLSLLGDASRRITESDSRSVELQKALTDRLHFRTAFLQSLSGSEVSHLDLTKAIDCIETSHRLAEAIPDAFSDKVQRQLATSTPPRPMLHTTMDEACQKWTQMCTDIEAAHRLTQPPIIASPANLHRAIWTFSYRSKPFALSRAILQDILFAGEAIGGQLPHYEFLLHDISELALEGHPMVERSSFQIEVTTDWRHQCSRLIESFFDKAIEEYLNMYRMICQNRCRIRRTFTQAIPILDAMEAEAAETDIEIAKVAPNLTMKVEGNLEHLNPLASWARFHRLRVMAWTVQLGLETEIYMDDELAGMYFFLAWLYRQQSDLLSHLLLFTRKRSAKTLASTRVRSSEQYLESLHRMSQIHHHLAEALWNSFTILTHLGVIARPKRSFANEQFSYEARMKPFLTMTHDEIPPAWEMTAATELHDPVAEACSDVEAHLKDPRLTRLIADARATKPHEGKFVGLEQEWEAEIKGLKATSVAIAVAVSQIKRICAEHGEDAVKGRLECKVERKYTVWWAVPVLKVINQKK